MPPFLFQIKKILFAPAMLLATLIVLFEELVWDKITLLVGWLAKMRLVARLEAWIMTLDPYPTLALFAVPIITLVPLKILAVYFLTQGRFALGLGVILVAKTTSTAISARLFVIAKPKLMTFPTFVVVYNKVLQFTHWAHEKIEGWPLTPVIRRTIATIKAMLQPIRTTISRWFTTKKKSPLS